MTDTAAPRRPAPDPQEDWAATRGVLMSYAYLGSRPRAIDSSSAENVLDLRSDLRTPVGAVLAAPLAIAMLDAATVNVEGMRVLAVTQVDIEHRRLRARYSPGASGRAGHDGDAHAALH